MTTSPQENTSKELEQQFDEIKKGCVDTKTPNNQLDLFYHIHNILFKYTNRGILRGSTNFATIQSELLNLFNTELDKRERVASIATAKLILKTCKYEGREFYLSKVAVEQMVEDLVKNSDDHKVITALNTPKENK